MQQTTAKAPAAAAPKPAPPTPPPNFQEGAIATMDAAGLIAILKDPGASEFQKAKACQRAGELADKAAVPALAALLGDEHLNVYARYGLEPIADASASEALRAALPKLKGNLLIGAVNSLGKRRDSKAVPVLAKMVAASDAELARAAATALGNIAGAAAYQELKLALAKTSGLLKQAVADAALRCAEQLLKDGQRKEALALYEELAKANLPQPAHLGAMAAIIRVETSTARPR